MTSCGQEPKRRSVSLRSTTQTQKHPVPGGGVVAHVSFCPVSIQSPKSCELVGLGPMAVDPDHQRAGLGRRLIEEGLVRCRAAGYDGVVVLGHPAYYPKFGFVRAGTRGIHREHEVQGDPFMVLELTPQALDGVTGVVRYLPEFLSLNNAVTPLRAELTGRRLQMPRVQRTQSTASCRTTSAARADRRRTLGRRSVGGRPWAEPR